MHRNHPLTGKFCKGRCASFDSEDAERKGSKSIGEDYIVSDGLRGYLSDPPLLRLGGGANAAADFLLLLIWTVSRFGWWPLLEPSFQSDKLIQGVARGARTPNFASTRIFVL